MLEKIKSAKSAKLMMKHLGSTEKEKKKKEYTHETASKKKFKLRKSEVEINEKMPVRFNTEANEKDEWWCEPSKLKKTNIIKGKQMA